MFPNVFLHWSGIQGFYFPSFCLNLVLSPHLQLKVFVAENLFACLPSTTINQVEVSWWCTLPTIYVFKVIVVLLLLCFACHGSVCLSYLKVMLLLQKQSILWVSTDQSKQWVMGVRNIFMFCPEVTSVVRSGRKLWSEDGLTANLFVSIHHDYSCHEFWSRLADIRFTAHSFKGCWPTNQKSQITKN